MHSRFRSLLGSAYRPLSLFVNEHQNAEQVPKFGGIDSYLAYPTFAVLCHEASPDGNNVGVIRELSRIILEKIDQTGEDERMWAVIAKRCGYGRRTALRRSPY